MQHIGTFAQPFSQGIQNVRIKNRKIVGLNLSYHKIEDQFLDSIASIRVDVIAKLDQGGQKPMESDGGCISDLA